jgi:uncharacterized protein
MHVTVFGASGAIGSTIAAELLAQGHEVSGVSRRGTSTVSGVRPVTGDASDVDHVAELVSGAAAVITAIGPRLDGSGPTCSVSRVRLLGRARFLRV